MREKIERVEDLEVFRREGFSPSLTLLMSAFALPIPPASLTARLHRPTERSATAGGSIAPGIEIDLREPGRGLRPAESFCGGVSAVPDGCDRQQ